ncbi:MAG: YidC/Oxa1 family membrane protein insertase, partial [Oscillospiraceae bacterium]
SPKGIFHLEILIYKPLSYMLTVPKELVQKLTEITTQLMTAGGATISATTTRMIETNVIEQVKTNIGAFSSLTANPEYAEWINKISNLDMSIGSANLWNTPSIKEPSLLWLVVIFSVVTMLLSSFISMKTSGGMDAQGGSQGKMMMIMMSVMFAVFSFMYPAGFSLYWGFQNLIIIGQSLILKKMVDPEKLKEQTALEMEEKKKAAKKKSIKTIKIVDEKSGEVVEKEISAAELEKLRLQKARELKDSPYDN